MSSAESASGSTLLGDETQITTSDDTVAEAGMSMRPFLLSQKEAAALLGISPRTLARRSADGTIPSFLIGRRRVYSRFRIAEWVARQAA